MSRSGTRAANTCSSRGSRELLRRRSHGSTTPGRSASSRTLGSTSTSRRRRAASSSSAWAPDALPCRPRLGRTGDRGRLVARDAGGVRGGRRGSRRREARGPSPRRPRRSSGVRTRPARHVSLPRVPAPPHRRGASGRARGGAPTARAERAVRVRRLRARRRRRRRDARPLAGARAGDLRARRVGPRAPTPHPLGPRLRGRHDDGACVALTAGVARADRAGRLRGSGALRLVRPASVPWRRGLGLDRQAARRVRVAS